MTELTPDELGALADLERDERASGHPFAPNDDDCPTCGAARGEPHGLSQSPDPPYGWANTCDPWPADPDHAGMTSCGACGGWHDPRERCDLDVEIVDDVDEAREGWAIFACPGATSYGYWQMQRDDEQARFDDDTEVWRHVYTWAILGSPLHQRALAFIAFENPLEWANVVRWCITKDDDLNA